MTDNEFYLLCCNQANQLSKLKVLSLIDEFVSPCKDLKQLRLKYIYKDVSASEMQQDMCLIDNIKLLYYYYD
jgi:hypothetical protein